MSAVRCAIYTRKSTEEGLDMQFNSLDAQREACEAYIASQKHEGWKALPKHYDDGGFSGGNTQRPALQALLTDIDSLPEPQRSLIRDHLDHCLDHAAEETGAERRATAESER